MVIMMATDVRELRPRPPETEKITINLGYVDLGHVDLMAPEGFYSNRTDFIRTAKRQPRGSRSGAARGRNAAQQCAGPCQHLPGRHAGACSRHHRLSLGAG